MPIAALITLLLTEAPAAIDLINRLRDQGRTVPTEQEIAELGLSDTNFDAAYARLFGTSPDAPAVGDSAANEAAARGQAGE